MLKILKISAVVLGITFLSSCSSSPKVGSDILWACTLVDDVDPYRVGIMMITAAAKSDPSLVDKGRGNPYDYIDRTVRNFSYPGVTDTLEATDIKNKLADSLDLYASAVLVGEPNAISFYSSELDRVAISLQQRCSSLGYQNE